MIVGGPCTVGPGLIVGTELKEQVRVHHDLLKEKAKHVSKASKVSHNHIKQLAIKSNQIKSKNKQIPKPKI